MTDPTQQIIPARIKPVTAVWVHVFFATLAGLAVRLFFVLQFPTSSDDSKTYLLLARNWADHHVYGLSLNSKLIPTDLRLPGYPAYLAGVATLLGRSQMAIMLSQAALDLVTCYLTALLAAALVPPASRRRVAMAGLWLAVTCPFVANYTAVVLTEVLATFMTTAALACFAFALRDETNEFQIGSVFFYPTANFLVICGAIFTGLASLVRPEMPLLLIVAGGVIALRWLRLHGWTETLRIGAIMAVAFFAPLTPWTLRNFVTLHEFQSNAPRYAQLPGESVPTGFYAWTGSWMYRFRDVYQTVWKLGSDPIDLSSIPPNAFDSAEEKQQVVPLIDRYNRSPNLDISPTADEVFRQIAENRTRRHPPRTYLWIPFQRALTIWFTPRTELLPFSGKVWPIAQRWEDDPVDFLATIFLGSLGYMYVALAIAGTILALRSNRVLSAPAASANSWGIALLLAYVMIRTTFLTTVEAPEPRYVVSCYPAVLALAAMIWMKSRKSNAQ